MQPINTNTGRSNIKTIHDIFKYLFINQYLISNSNKLVRQLFIVDVHYNRFIFISLDSVRGRYVFIGFKRVLMIMWVSS